MTIAEGTLYFFFGSLCGSFFYTLALRYISGLIKKDPLKALFSSSVCVSCGEPVKKYHLVPLLSYLILRGKCSRCDAKISLFYPFYEILYGILFLLTMMKFGLNIHSVSVFLLISIALVISIVDIQTLTIPDSLVILFLLFSLYSLVVKSTFLDCIYGFLLMFMFFALVLFIFPGSFGGGDIKLASVIGLFLGLENSVVALETALVTGAVTGIIYGLKAGKNLRIKMPFGPFLTTGLIVAVFYGRKLVLLYYNTFY
jgi:prepilin signal peptidase PulO-like enzyme (type II secretory pathway)